MKIRTSRITGLALGGVMVAAAALTAAPAWADSPAAGIPCTASGSWYTEDTAPTQAADGLLFAGPSTPAVDWYHPVSGNLQGLPATSMTVTRASGYQTSLVFEIHRTGGADFSDYATIAAEPYQNGWTAGQTGVFTVTQDTKVWTSKIVSGPGSQAEPIALSTMAALFPSNTLISEGVHLQTSSAADQLTSIGAVSGCVNENFVAPVANVASGSWFTEDVAPVPASDGLLFAGPSTAPVDYYHPVSGNLQGVPTTTMTISRASGYQTSLVWEIYRTGTSGYATIVAEPYQNGWAAGQTGVFTVTQDTKVWTSKIANPAPGSQTTPISLRDMAALFPTNTLLTEGIHLGSNSVAGQLTSVATLSGCVNENFVAPVANVASGSWFTEDVAPVPAAYGLLFAGPSAAAVDYYHPVSGNLQGVPTTTMTISRASGYQTSLVWEVYRTGTSGYATIVAEPYMNGWVAGQTGTFTVNQSTLVWTSKIANPAPGSQASPITLAAMAALYPNNTLLTEGIHLGSSSVAGQLTSVTALTGAVNENFVPTPVVTPPAPVSPIEAYIAKVYKDLFGRSPDTTGLSNWSAALRTGTPYGQVANGITYSDEYRSGMIRGTYAKYLGRTPDTQGAAFWLEHMRSGWQIEQMQGGFISSDEYYAQGGGTDAGWITELYQNVLGRTPSAAEITFWKDHLKSGSSRATVAHGFLYSDEHLTTVVDGYYQSLLHRGIDPTGRQFWVKAIQSGSRDEQIIAGIVSSIEYRSNV